MSDFANLMISGIVLAMFGASGALFYDYIKSRGKEEVSKTIQAESEKVRIQSFIDADASKLGHVSGVLFQPWHHRYLTFLPDRKRPSRRAILNNNTMKGWPFDGTTFDYLYLTGKVRVQRAFEMGPIFSVGKWVQDQGYTWAGEANFPRIYDLYDVPIAKLRELQTGLSALISEPAQTFQMSGESYIGDIPFREKVLRYSKLEIEAEALLSINHEDFYLNPHSPTLEASKQNLAYVTDKASKLLRIVTEWMQAIEEPARLT
jgi:hypothetical protein